MTTGREDLPSISVVVMTTGGREVFERSLEAALADPATSELIVVVDHGDSTEVDEEVDRRLTWLDERAASDRRLRVLSLPPDDGLWRVQRGRDAGAELAGSEVLLALDDDVVLESGVVTGHARAHADAEGLVMVGYMPVVPPNRWPRSNATARYYSESYEAHCEAYEVDPSSILKALWGGNISVRRDAWLRAVQRPRLHAWGHDDQELGLLFLREGLHGSFDRSLRGAHHYRRSLPGFVERAEMSPAAQAKLVAANPDLLAVPPVTRGRRDQISGPVLWAARRKPIWNLTKAALEGLILGAATLRLNALEDLGAHYLWFLARTRAARELGA